MNRLLVLDDPHAVAQELKHWGLQHVESAQQTLVELAECGLTLDLLAALCGQLGQLLPAQHDPDAALDGLARFILGARSPLTLAALLERDESVLPMLLAALSLGPSFRSLLIADPEALDLLRMSGGQPLAREAMLAQAQAEIMAVEDERAAAAALRRVRDRHTLRIAYGDVVCRHKPQLVAEQLTYLAEAILESALGSIRRKTNQAAGAAIIALGRLGRGAMDYGRTLDLLLLYDPPTTETEAARRAATDACERSLRMLVKLLMDASGGEPTYNIRPMLLPDSQLPGIAHTADDTVLGLDNFGRTWHRQAMLAARPVAGDRELAQSVLQRLQPWVFRRYLNRADETGIGALRRRILCRGGAATTGCDVVNGRGGLADIEAAAGFLQLLFGGDQPNVRQQGTLAAIAGLEQAGILSAEERTLLESSYLWLRQVLHRLQVHLGPDETSLPSDDASLGLIARSLAVSDATQLVQESERRLDRVWEMLPRLLGAPAEDSDASGVVDLLLDPAPSAEQASRALSGYGLADPLAAAAHLHSLAQERVSFLSTRRCRHSLSLIVERLLAAIAATPDPDATLSNLASVSDSLGGKGVLWELFSVHPPSLQLYVRLCAASPYLSGILTANPGMIDDLVDSLQLGRLPDLDELKSKFAELARGSSDTLPIQYDLKNASHLRIGVRDILGQDPIEATHASLADVAEFSVAELVSREYEILVQKHGQPLLGPGQREGEPCRLVILGLGKLGGREPNYHSNLEAAFLYEGEGTTRPAPRTRQQRTTASHFYAQLAQRVLKQSSQLTPQGRLYNIDVLLRPGGSSGAVAVPMRDFVEQFESGEAPLADWRMLCSARPVFGEDAIRQIAQDAVRRLLASRTWQGTEPDELLRFRRELERSAAELNIKRGRGGTLDIEWLVQLLQLRHAAARPQVLMPGTQSALEALAAAGCLDRDDSEYFAESYRFLRRIESALRLLDTPARHDLPDSPLERSKLALLLGQPNGETVLDRTIMTLAENRRRFERIVGQICNLP